MAYTYNEIFNILGPEWHALTKHGVDGYQYWVCCRLTPLMGVTNTTRTFRGGNKLKPKMQPPIYRKHFIPEVNPHRPVNIVTIEGIYVAIMKTKKCRPLRIKLRKNGIKI